MYAFHSNNMLGRKVTLDEIPYTCDRIPNPFDRFLLHFLLLLLLLIIIIDSLGADANTWSFLTLNIESKKNKSFIQLLNFKF
jgi:hypothetical protein